MRFLALLLLVASVSGPVQEPDRYGVCIDKAKTQREMDACASDEAARVDAQLNEVYRELLSQAASQPEAIPKIKAAERAWILYRDAYIEAMYPAKDKQAEYGTVYPMEVDLLRARLSQRQVVALKELLQQYSRAKSSQNGVSDSGAAAPSVSPKLGG